MEAAAVKRMTTYSRYGSDTFKQVYIYGALDLSPTTFSARSFGLTWSLSGFLLTPFMATAGAEIVGRMRKRVVDELTTPFKSHYSQLGRASGRESVWQDVYISVVAVSFKKKRSTRHHEIPLYQTNR